MSKKQHSEAQDIEPGMLVKANKGDLGEEDISKPKVKEVLQDEGGEVKKLVVEKGVVFKKKIDIPAERVQAVDVDASKNATPGKVVVDVGKEEAKQLTAVGEETLTTENENKDDLLDQVEREIPTTDALKEMEAENASEQAWHNTNQKTQDNAQYTDVRVLDQVEREIPTVDGMRELEASKQETSDHQTSQLTESKEPNFIFRVLGPGFLAGMAGNDASAVGAYSVDGATNGYGHLWLLLLSTPLYHSVQFACAKLGRITQMGLAEILRTYYSRWAAIPASVILIIANVALIAADLVAIGSGFELITGLSWVWFVVPTAVILWYITVYHSFEAIKKIFIVMSLAFITYFITAAFSGANWGAVLKQTFVPQLDFSFASISSAVALLGATISPYTMFWQVQGEKEEKRPGSTKKQIRSAALDIVIGVISGNLVSYFIIVVTAATLFVHHQGINTAADAARSLEPLLGPFAKYLFALGFIGAGFIAIPVLLASTSYAVAGTFGWPSGLSKKPWQNEGFYLILTACLVISLVLALIHFDPIRLIFWANVLSGVLAPFIVVYLIIIGNRRKIMGSQKLGVLTNTGLVITLVVMFAAEILLFYGLATGKGS